VFEVDALSIVDAMAIDDMDVANGVRAIEDEVNEFESTDADGEEGEGWFVGLSKAATCGDESTDFDAAASASS